MNKTDYFLGDSGFLSCISWWRKLRRILHIFPRCTFLTLVRRFSAGIEVKPGKKVNPFHEDNLQGRLRVTQVILLLVVALSLAYSSIVDVNWKGTRGFTLKNDVEAIV